jgi:hypothetical protein
MKDFSLSKAEANFVERNKGQAGFPPVHRAAEVG